jgi:hydroxymethylpyrimidine/phosphomethylpyrimidine kinase
VRAFTGGIGYPDLCPLQPSPGDEFIRSRKSGRESEARTHCPAYDLGVGQIRRTLEGDETRGAQRQRSPPHGADVSGILNCVENQDSSTRNHLDVLQAPAFRLDDSDYALRMFGIGERLEIRIGYFFTPNGPCREGRFERFPAGSTFQRRGNRGPTNRYSCGERLFHESNAFGQGQPSPFPSAAAVKVPDQRLEGAAHGIAHPMKIALTIAGSDSGGGAGIQADLKTFQQFGVFGTSVIVALTAQNTLGVRAVEAVPEAMVSAQLTALAEDLPPAALKTGMLAEAGLVRRVARAIRENGWGPLVVDPVLVSSSGTRLLTTEAEEVMREDLLPLAALVTPNLDEAAILTGRVVHDVTTMERAAATLLRFGAAAALIKGGHLADDTITDVLVTQSGVQRFTHPRIDTTSSHGTGCTLSAAVTAGLALDRPLEVAIAHGLDFVHRAIAAAPGLGGGHGPLNHMVPGPTTAR